MPHRRTVPTVSLSVAVIGYGSQGRAMAQNLHDSGHTVRVGLRLQSRSQKLVRADRLPKPVSIPVAVSQSDIVVMALPDHVQKRVFTAAIAPYLRKGQTLLFLHGLAIHFKFILPPPGVSAILLAPHAPGVALRDAYLGTRQVSAFYAYADRSSVTNRRLLYQLAEGIGIRKEKLVKTTFRDEAVGDLFGEQAVLCGGLTGLILAGFNQLVQAGLPPRNAYLEVAYQLDLIISLIKKHGIIGMYERISVAARFGSERAARILIDRGVRKRMQGLFREIETGRFPRKLATLSDADITILSRKLRKLSSPSFERAVRMVQPERD